MTEINDSDCFIPEPNITCITLEDSSYKDSDEDVSGNHPPSKTYQDIDIVESEVTEQVDGIAQKENICEIQFLNKNQFNLFGLTIINSLKDSLSKQSGKILEIIEEDNPECVKLIVNIFQYQFENIPLPSNIITTAAVEKESGIFEKEFSPDLSGISELFTIDTAPALKIDTVKVPSYKRAIKDVLLDEEGAALKKETNDKNVFNVKKRNACFNCGETEHSIRECSKPHNIKRIKNAKKLCKRIERYHVDAEQRFAHIKPGRISDKLREALGLRKGQLPFFFYRMRVLGYPPGWLEDAKVEHSGINLFDSYGAKILDSDEDEGEVDAVKHKYNIAKIYDFPGFNQAAGNNFFDDYKYHNVPPFNKSQMKEEFIKTLGDNVVRGYKRKKLKEFPDGINNETVYETTDMEIEDLDTSIEVQFTRPLPPNEQPPSSPPQPTPSSSIKQSPSLIELEKEKQRLLQELQCNTSVIEIEDSLTDDIIDLANNDNYQHNNDSNNSDYSSKKTFVFQKAISESEISIIKQSFMGTPVLKFSPYNTLPNGDNFKVGVSDVINFENLPDSTGKYEQMKEVIKKVRNCVNKLYEL